ncbi:Validoxylamine A glucosyltransferase [Phycisphaerales bacterium]|nr:Validoxylamine A glucosyltransferase [Phycisphaerales bacterium]
MLVSFCVPAHNEEKYLPATLAAIHHAAHALQYEIIVADDASTDATAAIARANGASVVSIGRRQIAAARNAAAALARGPLLIFVDADTRVTPAAVRQAIAAVERGVVGGGGPVRFDGVVPLYARLAMPPLMWLFRIFRYTGGAFLFCTRPAFDAAGRWDESLFASEEIALANALKKLGRFHITRDGVITSGRKLRTHALGELLSAAWGAAKSRGQSLRRREGLEVWYGPRRDDPGGTHAHPEPPPVSRPETR